MERVFVLEYGRLHLTVQRHGQRMAEIWERSLGFITSGKRKEATKECLTGGVT